MQIRDMFAENIDRSINGVVQVEQDEEKVIAQELKEYVITKELKKHFMTFFNNYSDAFSVPTNDTGVWISGFFGSGKSHFLKMLSYLLENKEVEGIRSVERFREKFEDDPGTFMMIDRCTRGETETILFNIDKESSINKDKTAVLRVFAKVFYDKLGFFGDNLKVALLERYIDQEGKTEQFRRVFEEKKGKSWLECRRAFAFHGKAVIPALMETLDISEEDAKAWFADKSSTDYSIAQFVDDVKAYVATKPADYRLLFMADEVGQYVGTDTDLLLNLQSLVENLGSECRGKVWVVCTGQEAIDEIIKVRADEFSRIQARFGTRLSLSSSSVDEVVQKRILKKTPEASQNLEKVYEYNDSVLRNLFSFAVPRQDLKGYSGTTEFVADFPFVPYQFIVMQSVFNEIRKHGNAGKHQSNGERSMLSGFQEAAQKVKEQDENALVPFYLFYDTLNSFLDSTIRRVIDRCQNAADNGDGLKQQDVNVLKLLYLIRYIDDIPGNLDNIVILMADRINMDKISMREKIRDSLNRLLHQNYIGRTGEVYNFLTDEEQDIQREIRNTIVDTAKIVERLGHILYTDIYAAKKFRYDNYDFAFDQLVDGMLMGAATGGMRLRFLTFATDATDKAELRLMTQSKGREAIVVLPEAPYYEDLENALKIRQYVRQRNISQLPKSVQDIISAQQEDATRYEASAKEDLIRAVESAEFYVDGEHLDKLSGPAKAKIDQALQYLVTHVYSELALVDKNMSSDADIIAILNGSQEVLPGMEPNRDAAAKMEEYLDIQHRKNLPTSMADLQSRYQAIPYGWREIDIAAVAAQLIYDQRITVKYGGATVRVNDPRLPDMLRKKSEIGKTIVSIHVRPSDQKMRAAKELLRDYFDMMDVPEDENGLVAFILERFEEQKKHYEQLKARYQGHKYPDQDVVPVAIQAISEVLSQQKDNIALIDALLMAENKLFDCKDQMQRVEGFVKNQVQIFDAAVEMENELLNDLNYLKSEPEADEALNKIRLIINGDSPAAKVYRQIPELNALMYTVHQGHERLLEKKRSELLNISSQCLSQIHQTAGGDPHCKDAIDRAQRYYDEQDKKIRELRVLTLLDGQIPPMWDYKDMACQKIEALKTPPVQPPVNSSVEHGKRPVAPARRVKQVYRQGAFPAKTLKSQQEIDQYVQHVRDYLTMQLQDADEIHLK